MSQLEVDKVIPQSGTTLTLGESGDTITIASGATFTPTLIAPIIDEINDNNGNEEIIFTTTTSAVNELTIANAATGNAPEIAATGDDTDIDLKLTPKGAGNLVLDGIEFPNADGSASQVLQTNGSGVLSFATLAAGITVADQWRLTTNFTGNADPIASNLERIDNATRGNGTLGTGMTESSGIFTFPSTGIWLIKFYHNSFLNGDSRAVSAFIQTTVDNSNYDVASQGEGFITQTNSNTTLNSSAQEVLFDVTNTTTHKCRFRIDVVTATTTTQGSTNVNVTYMTFIRLGDT